MTQSKNTISLKYKAILTMLAAALFASCTNIISRTPADIIDGGGINQGDNSVRGALTVTTRVSNGASRYAMPSPSVSDFVYAAILYTGKSPANPPSENFVKGEPSGDKFVFSFQRPDETEGFTLEVFAFKADTTTFSKDNALLSGKKTGLKVNGDKIEVVETIALSVYEKSEEKGTVSLQIKVPADCTLTIDDTTHFVITGTAPNFTITQNGTDIPAGVYSVTFTVKKVNGDKTEIIHIFPESINVLPGMCTDTWWNGATSSATKEITQSMISSTVYVRGENALWYASYAPNAMADDKNSGSYLSPLATIQKAVDTIIARNDGTSEYTICVDGTLDGTTAEYLGAKGMADLSALVQDLNLTIKALSGTATLDGGARFGADGNVEAAGIRKRIIYASTPSIVLNLTLENLIVTGGYYYSGYGGGIVFSSPDGELKISNGTAICGNKGLNAGGVMVSSGTFYMSGGKINNCTTELGYQGGGVYINSGGKFIMKGGAISSNKAGLGGGVMVYRGTFDMSGGTIGGENAEDGNTANAGGGVYVNRGTFTMEGGTIIGNEATGKGSGVYQYGMFNMSGTAKVAEDNDVYLFASDSNFATITVAGALEAESPVATITPSAYTENRPLLSAGENVPLDGSICDKFAVMPQNDGTEWRVALDGADGVLIRKYAIGETGPGGGTVFYYSADGFTVNDNICHYLEVSKESLGVMKWCPCSACDLVQSTTNGIGAGYANTQAIINQPNHASATASNCAAKACAEYYTDTAAAGEWFLPNYKEAKEMYQGIIVGEDLWSSSSGSMGSNNTSYAYYMDGLSSGGVNITTTLKSETYSVRAVHAF